jgi:hypothetical protein
MPTPTDPAAGRVPTNDLAAEIRARHRGLLRELRIEAVEGGVALFGRAYTFYGKQVALHEVRRRCRTPVVANHIIVG